MHFLYAVIFLNPVISQKIGIQVEFSIMPNSNWYFLKCKITGSTTVGTNYCVTSLEWRPQKLSLYGGVHDSEAKQYGNILLPWDENRCP